MKLLKKLNVYSDVEYQAPLSKHTTYRIGGKSRYFIYPKNEMCLMTILDILKEEEIPFKVLGKGSNILCGDEDYEGAIICLDRYFNEFYFEEDGTCVAQAGTSIILLAHEAMKQSLSGLEFASGIPGTVGGAVFMNAGAYRSDMGSILTEVFVLKDGICTWMKKDELNFHYRHSTFQEQRTWIVLGVRMKLSHGDQKEIRDLMDSRRKRRMESQPLNKPSAGSVFRNPDNAQAWELIERIGYRGKQVGGAMVSPKHANFIINTGDAKAQDVISLVTMIQKEVKQQFDIDLRMEVEKFNWKQ